MADFSVGFIFWALSNLSEIFVQISVLKSGGWRHVFHGTRQKIRR